MHLNDSVEENGKKAAIFGAFVYMRRKMTLANSSELEEMVCHEGFNALRITSALFLRSVPTKLRAIWPRKYFWRMIAASVSLLKVSYTVLEIQSDTSTALLIELVELV